MLKDSLIDWMPQYYKGAHTRAIQEARDKALTQYEAGQKRVYDDMFISSAKDIWLWEKECSVTPTSDNLEERRKNVLAAIRNSRGNITKTDVENLILGYIGDGTVVVTEHAEDFLVEADCYYNSSEEFSVSDLIDALLNAVQAHVAVKINRITYDTTGSSIYFALAPTGNYIVAPLIST